MNSKQIIRAFEHTITRKWNYGSCAHRRNVLSLIDALLCAPCLLKSLFIMWFLTASLMLEEIKPMIKVV